MELDIEQEVKRMKSNQEISSLIEAMMSADERRIEADKAFAASLKDVESAFQERAQALVEQLKLEGKTESTLRNKITRITGWVLLHHQSTPAPLKWPSLPDGLMLVVDRHWKFWLVERGPAFHDPTIEVTYDIRELKTDRLAYSTILWSLLQAASDSRREEAQP